MVQTEDIILKKKIQSFKTIYRAIHEAKRNSFDNDFLVGKEYLSLQEYEKTLEEYCQTKKSNNDKIYSNVFQAWRLAKIHHDACREDNEILFSDIYNCIFMTQRPRYRVARFLQKKKKDNDKNNSVKKPGLLSKLNFFKKMKQPEAIEMEEMESVERLVEVNVGNEVFEQKHLTFRDIDDKKLNSEIIWHIYYNLANPIPSGEIWPRPRAELGF